MWDFFNERQVRARKRYLCEEADCEILPGDLYSYVAGVFDGEFLDQRLCRDCRFLADVMTAVFGFDDGFPLTELRRELREEFGVVEDPMRWAIRAKAALPPFAGLPQDWAVDPRASEALAGEPVRIWSGEHVAYWRANAQGYVEDVEAAGIYSFEDALAHIAHCGPEKRLRIRAAWSQ